MDKSAPKGQELVAAGLEALTRYKRTGKPRLTARKVNWERIKSWFRGAT